MTHKRPTKAGFYWYRALRDGEGDLLSKDLLDDVRQWQVVKVDDGGCGVYFVGWEGYEDPIDDWSEWGPRVEPPTATQEVTADAPDPVRRRWWCSWYGPPPGDDWRSVLWPMPAAWLGYWCSGSDEHHSNMVGWIEAETAEEVAELVAEGWPECVWRIAPQLKLEAPGERFPRPEWVDAARWA